MTLTKKEKILIAVLLVLVYIFVFVKFVLLSSIPKIKLVHERIKMAQVQLDALERDYQNIENFKRQIKENEVIDERLGEYLMDNAGMSDSVIFVENLALLMGSKLKGISLGAPKQVVQENTVYYAFPVRFSTVLPEEGLNELIEYIEGGSRKVTVSTLSLKLTDEENAREYGISKSNDQLFDINIGLEFYSLDKDAADSLAKFTRAAIKRFIEDNELPVFIEELKETDNILPSEPVKVSDTGNTQSKNTSGEITLRNADFKIFHSGYLFGGYNFETYSEFNRSERIRSHISVPVDVTLTLGKTQYTIESVDGHGYTDMLTGNLTTDRDFTLFIESNISTEVKENENLWVNLYIRNDSGKRLIVRLEQTGNRVKIMDRSGNIIDGKNEKEKVYLQ
ncbi:MAG: hypothetical protein GXZ01_04920 [Clostridiaceae bacterium]|jgi:hypothetical protein|nr:hypothetical protein [Clostridiaceae bacterium]